MAYGFDTPKVATLKFKVAVNMDKNIAQLGEIITGYKIISIRGFKADGTLVEAKTIIDAVLDTMGGGIYDLKKVQKVITSFVADNDIQYIEVDFTASDIAPIFSGTYTPASMDLKPSVDSIFAGTYQVQGITFSAADFTNL